MGRFLARRGVQAILTVLVATFVLFSAVTLLPGDPIQALFGFQDPDPEAYATLVTQFHFDRPFLIQYWLFMRDLLTFDFGFSFPRNPFGSATVGPPIGSILTSAIPISLRITAGVTIFQLLVSPLIVMAAGLRERSLADRIAHGGSVLLVSVPVLVAAFALQALLGRWNSILPPVWVDPLASWRHYVLPILALGLGTSAHLALVAREELLVVLSQPYITTARALGIPQPRIVTRHALKPSLGPTIELFAANLAILITGLVVVEGVFEVPGIGGTLLSAIYAQDRVLIVTVLTAVLIGVIIINTLSDILHAAIDPRLRTST